MRVFISFHISSEMSIKILESVGNKEGFSPYPSQTFHTTLQFIGDVEESEINLISGVLSNVTKAFAPFTISPERFVNEDYRLRLHLEKTPALLRFQSLVHINLREVLKREIQSIPYEPHITLGITDESFDVGKVKISNLSLDFSNVVLFESVQREDKIPQYKALSEFPLLGEKNYSGNYSKVILPTRPQVDTLIANFILQKFGEMHFPGIRKAGFQFFDNSKQEKKDESAGIVYLDSGGEFFDHHNKESKTTASKLVTQYLQIEDNPSLEKLLQLAERDDFFGKGTISTDPLDRAFGFSGLVTVLNKKYSSDLSRVIEITYPIIEAFFDEEERRNKEMPEELERALASGKAQVFKVRQRKKNLKCIYIESDNISMPGFLRSRLGGAYDVVAQKRSSGHINILTRPTKRIDLRSLALVIRLQEGEVREIDLPQNPKFLISAGVIEVLPMWYYDTATNSILNGGATPDAVPPTQIDSFDVPKIIEIGLSEKLWSPFGAPK